ncbi:MAG: GntR family transcriptional regulator [Alphaproteobacteria bacterium]
MAPRLSDRAYNAVRGMLSDGTLRAGQFVSQRELCDLTDMPIAPTREAIQKLASEFLVTVIPQRGIRIAEATPKAIRNAFGLRLMIESAAVRRFCETCTADEAEALIARHQAVRDSIGKTVTPAEVAEAHRIDQQMHVHIVQALANELIESIYTVNLDRIRLLRHDDGLMTPSALRQSFDEHITLLLACRDRDIDAAVEAIGFHIGATLRMALGL